MPLLETAAGKLFCLDNDCPNPDAPTLLLLHSGGGTHRQWRQLIAQMDAGWRILAPDLVGHGETPALPQPFALEDELALLAVLLQQADGPMHVVGHSYGGALALELARRHPARIASLAVYEPVMFRLLRDSDRQDAWREIATLGQRMVDLAAAGELGEAASVFLGYWIAPGAFEAMPAGMRAGIAASMAKVAGDFALMLQAGPVDTDFGMLAMPVLLLGGTAPTGAMRGVMAELRRLLPAAQAIDVAGAGHMGPLQRPDLVNPLLADFLAAAARSGQGLRHAG
jgi:pimeloyl-ACP methyl ester carboxylesterase